MSTTAVTGTVKDQAGEVLWGGVLTASFDGPLDANVGGQSFPRHVTAPIAGDGTFAVTVTDNGSVWPVGSRWRFEASQLGSQPQWTNTVVLPVTGPSVDISTQIAFPPPIISAEPIPRAYSSADVPNPTEGSIYWDLNLQNLMGYWNGTWHELAMAYVSANVFTDGEVVAGSGTLFTLAQPPVPPSSVQLYTTSGQLLVQGTDYTVSSTGTIVLATSHPAGSLIAYYRTGMSGVTGPSFVLGGDLSGTATIQTVIGFDNIKLDLHTMGAPTNGQVITYNSVTNTWQAQAPQELVQVNSDWNATSGVAQILNKPAALMTPGGDLSGSLSSQVVSGIYEIPVDAASFTSPQPGDLISYDASSHSWILTPATDVGGDVALSQLFPAIGANTIDNATFTQRWNWTLSGNVIGFILGETTPGTGNGYLVMCQTLNGSTISPFAMLASSNGFILNPQGVLTSNGAGAISMTRNTSMGGNQITLITSTLASGGVLTADYSNPNGIQLAGGANKPTTGTQWTAMAPSAAIVSCNPAPQSGSVNIYGDTGLTVGTPYTPTLLASFTPAGLVLPSMPNAVSLSTDNTGRIIPGTGGVVFPLVYPIPFTGPQFEGSVNKYSAIQAGWGGTNRIFAMSSGCYVNSTPVWQASDTQGCILQLGGSGNAFNLTYFTGATVGSTPGLSQALNIDWSGNVTHYAITVLPALASALGAPQIEFGTGRLATILAGTNSTTGAQILDLTSGAYFNGTSFIATATSACYIQVGFGGGNMFVIGGSTNNTIGSATTWGGLFYIDWLGNVTHTASTILPMSPTANGPQIQFGPATGAGNCSIDQTAAGFLHIASGAYVNASSQWIPTTTQAFILCIAEPAGTPQLQLYSNVGLTAGVAFPPNQIFNFWATGAACCQQIFYNNAPNSQVFTAGGLYLGGQMTWNGTSWIARAASGSALAINAPGYGVNATGGFAFLSAGSSGLTVGAAATMSIVATISSTGGISGSSVGSTGNLQCQGNLYVYSPDASRYLAFRTDNGGYSHFSSNTGYLIGDASTNIQLQGGALQLYSADVSRYLAVSTPNGGDPGFNSTTSYVNFSGGIRIGGTNLGLFVYSSGLAGPYGQFFSDGANIQINCSTGWLYTNGQFTAQGVIHAPVGIDFNGTSITGSASWLVNNSGPIRGHGFGTQPGPNGAPDGGTFCIDGSRNLWINTGNWGVIQTSSDYRIKTNVVPYDADALAIVAGIRVVEYEFQNLPNDPTQYADGLEHVGFIAHEVGEVFPPGCWGEKDALTPDGNVQPQGIRQLDMLALLTRAIQQLEERLFKLENPNGREPRKRYTGSKAGNA